jgi:hypothetical protein
LLVNSLLSSAEFCRTVHFIEQRKFSFQIHI